MRFSPDGTKLVVSRCNEWDCAAQMYAVADGSVVKKLPTLTAPHPSFSGEGHWIVAGGTLLHLPSETSRSLDTSASISTAIFAPNGDIIAGTNDFGLLRYCRTR